MSGFLREFLNITAIPSDTACMLAVFEMCNVNRMNLTTMTMKYICNTNPMPPDINEAVSVIMIPINAKWKVNAITLIIDFSS